MNEKINLEPKEVSKAQKRTQTESGILASVIHALQLTGSASYGKFWGITSKNLVSNEYIASYPYSTFPTGPHHPLTLFSGLIPTVVGNMGISWYSFKFIWKKCKNRRIWLIASIGITLLSTLLFGIMYWRESRDFLANGILYNVYSWTKDSNNSKQLKLGCHND